MKHLSKKSIPFYECSFPLSLWARGTDLLSEIITQIDQYHATLHQLYQWKQNKLVLPRYALSTTNNFVFWAHESIIKEVLQLHGIRGGFRVVQSTSQPSSLPNSRKKKQAPRSQRVLLDLDCDSSELIHSLKSLGVEVVCFWNHLADIYHYELIELCATQNFDILVTKNDRLFTPRGEWIELLFPRSTKLYVISQELLRDYKQLSIEIHRRIID